MTPTDWLRAREPGPLEPLAAVAEAALVRWRYDKAMKPLSNEVLAECLLQLGKELPSPETFEWHREDGLLVKRWYAEYGDEAVFGTSESSYLLLEAFAVCDYDESGKIFLDDLVVCDFARNELGVRGDTDSEPTPATGTARPRPKPR